MSDVTVRLDDLVSALARVIAEELEATDLDTPGVARPVASAQRGDHEAFERLRDAIPAHLMPRDAFAGLFPERDASRVSVVAIAFPMAESTVLENAKCDDYPARRWMHTRRFCDRMFPKATSTLVAYLRERDVAAGSVSGSPVYESHTGPEGTSVPNWSERHVGYACGLGTFGLHGALITDRGAAHRLISIVAGCEFDSYGEVDPNPLGRCLLRADGKCGNCIARCPAGALSPEGRDNAKCRDHAYIRNRERSVELYGIEVAGCGLCMTGVPCAMGNPVRS